MSNEFEQTDTIGLALSGGGFRATLFHIGSLWRLNELGFLSRLTRVTSVSGGSIISGMLGRHYTSLEFERGMATNIREIVFEPVRAFCRKNIDSWAIALGALTPRRTAADYVVDAYDRDLFKGASLQDLPNDSSGPRFIIYATSLQTGRSVRFSRPYIADYQVGRLLNPDVKLAIAVAASSAFPPVLAPLEIETDPDSWEVDSRSDLSHDQSFRRKLILADGGIYDNLGLEALTGNVRTILVSDAGGPLTPSSELSFLERSNTGIAYRTNQIVIEQTRALRRRALVANLKAKVHPGTYWGISTKIENYLDNIRLPKAMMMAGTDLTASLNNIRTRLNAFSDEEQGYLINWGYALADAAMRRHVLAPDAGIAPPRWPVPEYALGPLN